MKILIILLLSCVASLAQTSSDLRKRYSDPVSETFLVRPNVTVTVTYAKNGKPHEMLIQPVLPKEPIKSSVTKLSREVLDEVMDELVPMKERGESGYAGFVNMRCLPNDDCWGTSQDYKRVFIYYNVSGKNEYRYATIQWKDESKQSLPKP